MTFICIKTIFC